MLVDSSPLEPFDPVLSAIIEILSRKPETTMVELHSILREEFSIEFSRQYLYRLVNKLIEHKVVVKFGKILALDLRWLLRLKSFTSATIENVQSRKQVVEYLLSTEEGNERHRICDTLYSLTALWEDTMMSLFTQEKVKEHFSFSAHAYWTVYKEYEMNEHLTKIVEKEGIDYKIAIKGDSFLDRLASRQVLRGGCKIFITPSINIDKEGYAVNIIGDYIIESQFPSTITTYLDFFFDTTMSKNEFDVKKYLEVFNLQNVFTLTVRRNKEEAEHLRSVILSSIKSV